MHHTSSSQAMRKVQHCIFFLKQQMICTACSLVIMAYTSTEQAVNIYQYSWEIINSLNHLIN